MTYKLPFDLKQKPVNKYCMNGVIKFSCREGNLYYIAKFINKSSSATLSSGQVKSKAHLTQLLSIKHINEIPTIEVVQ